MKKKKIGQSDTIEFLKNEFEKKRKKIKKNFFKQKSGQLNCEENSNAIDYLIKKLFEKLQEEYGKITRSFLICAVGGYGRRQLAPFSDIDLLFIYYGKIDSNKLENFVKFLLYPLWDLKLKIGYAVRSSEEVMEFSKKDHVIKTSMLDARIISGSRMAFKKIMKAYFEYVSSNSGVFLGEKINERKKKINETNYNYFRNEPNIKESEGSIRDLNLIIWCLKIFQIYKKKNTTNYLDFLSSIEKKKFKNAQQFLLTIRCFLHYLSERSNEKLTFDYQELIAEKIEKKKSTKILNSQVEDMMRDYFEQITITRNLAKVIVNVLDADFKKKSQPKKRQDLKKLNDKFMKNTLSGSINFSDFRDISNNLNKINNNVLFSKFNIEIFKKIFFSQNQEKFMEINDVGLLSKIIPEFKRISNLTQFDRFHALTVGQHTLKAINILKDIKKRVSKKNYSFSKIIFSERFDKKPLFYAALLHDIGKGYSGEHNLKGATLAEKILTRLNEKKTVIKETSWLIKNHLILSEVAFKKDIEDYSIIKKTSENIENLDRLRSLFLLTVADISAVDQGIWNNWKSSLLKKLFEKVEKEISKPMENKSLNQKISLIKKGVRKLKSSPKKSEIEEFSKITYPNYWLLQSPESISFQIKYFFSNGKKIKNFDFQIKKFEEDNFLELTIVTNDRPSLFLDLIIIFMSENISIFESRIFTFDDGTVIDTFKLSYINYKKSEKDLQEKISSLKKKIQEFGLGKKLPKITYLSSKNKIIREKNDVTIDNNSSSTYTILEVITNDRPGLLYEISNVLIKNNLKISMAKISTNGDFVEDSFHLRNQYGLKIDKTELLEDLISQIKKTLSMKEINVS